jgi:hypothetical protein
MVWRVINLEANSLTDFPIQFRFDEKCEEGICLSTACAAQF